MITNRAGTIFAWVFFTLSVIYLILQWDPMTMQWNMQL
jgi:hypothetical protein